MVDVLIKYFREVSSSEALDRQSDCAKPLQSDAHMREHLGVTWGYREGTKTHQRDEEQPRQDPSKRSTGRVCLPNDAYRSDIMYLNMQ